jgi:hypothetical protein
MQAAMRGCLARRQFAEKKLAMTMVSFMRDCRPELLDACWELLQ